MIPLHLSLSGFLSYRDPVEVDFSTVELACISGPNGAGKSSLLDAITWVLFGQARKRDDSLINSRCNAAKVELIFEYEGNIYRVLRLKPREKSAVLEFHVLQPDSSDVVSSGSVQDAHLSQRWKSLTEHTLRETENRIQDILRMDYETFINASFFLQGKADQFTQQRPGDRKRILSSILGLEIWEIYREQAATRRKKLEEEVATLDGRLREITEELAEEEQRKARLEELQSGLKRLVKEREVQENLLTNLRQLAAILAEQQKGVAEKARDLEAARQRLVEMEARLEARLKEKEKFADLLARAAQIEAEYAEWQSLRARLEEAERVAQQFREWDKRREQPRLEIEATRARLEQELQSLLDQHGEAEAAQAERDELDKQLKEIQQELIEVSTRLVRKDQLNADLQTALQQQAEAKSENNRLKKEMDELKQRIDALSEVEGAICPLCGQLLEPADRQALIERLNLQGKDMGDQYRKNSHLLKATDGMVIEIQAEISGLAQVEARQLELNQKSARLNSQISTYDSKIASWKENGAPRLEEIKLSLQQGNYAPEARRQLAKIDDELRQIGYDAAAHELLRQQERERRTSEEEMRLLGQARAALVPLETTIDQLSSDIAAQRAEITGKEEECQRAAEALSTAQAQAPNLEEAEQVLFTLKEQEAELIRQKGAAEQMVRALEDLKTRRKTYEAQREELAQQVRQYKQLERAFSKDGVPALLIEQALPEIEAKANEILDRLSGGNMSVRFVTQAAYKDKAREDLRETLDIQISDSAGVRDYEMYSGGEAFRVNFAIRLALSEILAQRAGARLQTLVIDEGFGSQDAQGRQRLIEAINLVRPDFAKILVITHIDELKEAFPTRIEVEKTERGSAVNVIS